jgi:hypothetical protein
MAGMVIESRYRPHVELDAEVAEACDWVADGEDPPELRDMELFARFPWTAHDALRRARIYLSEHRDDHERLTAALMASDGHLNGADAAARGLSVAQIADAASVSEDRPC